MLYHVIPRNAGNCAYTYFFFARKGDNLLLSISRFRSRCSSACVGLLCCLQVYNDWLQLHYTVLRVEQEESGYEPDKSADILGEIGLLP